MPGRLTFITRLWFYFRTGYSTYLTFVLGFVSTLVTIYYLAIKNLPSLLDIFPKFAEFGVAATLVGVPLAILVGWAHLKRSSAFTSEADIVVEAHPYNYKLPPGYWRETVMPVYLELLTQLKRLLEREDLLKDEDRIRIQSLEEMMDTLIKGGYVGTPRRAEI